MFGSLSMAVMSVVISLCGLLLTALVLPSTVLLSCYLGKVSNSQIKSNLDAGRVVILNVHNGGHWVLAYGYNGDTIMVNDPGYNVASYTLSQIVDGQNGIYTVTRGWQGWLQGLYSDIYYGWLLQYTQERVEHNDNLMPL
jgi:hypothetical protein